MSDLFLDNRIAGLIIKYLQDDITEIEFQELQEWIDSHEDAKEIFDELTSEEKLSLVLSQFMESRQRVLAKIHLTEPETKVEVPPTRLFRWRPWLAAAMLIGLAFAG